MLKSLQRILPITRASLSCVWRPLLGFGLTLGLASNACAEPPAATRSTSPDTAKVTAEKAERHGLELLQRRDYKAAAHEFAVAAQAGRPLAQYRLADQLTDGLGVAADGAQAFKWYSAAAQQGVAGAQTVLGWRYLTGAGTQRDPHQAARWLAAAARQDEPAALRLLSMLYRNGIGVQSDVVFSDRLIERAAELNDPEACRQLGLKMLYGTAPQRDASYGLQLLRKAADKTPDGSAAFALGWWYLSSQSSALELRTAVRWMTASAQAEHAMGGLWLSHLYRTGLGVELNSNKANQLLEHALSRANLSDKNNFAWQLSVNPDGMLRDGPLALRIMQTELAAPNARTPAYLDTLAAAYAEVGNFERAVEAQQNALAALAPAERAKELGMHERLRIYRGGRPFREARR